MKNLIYFTVGGLDDYIKLTKCCISSIRNTNDQAFDIMIMCDEKYKKNIDINNVDIMIVKDNINHIKSSMRKVEIFSYPKIWNYENVLYLDSDIIVNGNLNILFDRIQETDKLYIKKESHISLNSVRYWWSKKLNENDIKNINDNNMHFFNCGQFLFKVSKTMERHFSNILNNIDNYTGIFFYEQTFMNEYFLETSNIILDTVIQNNITVDSIEMYNKKEQTLNDFIIIHFANASVDFNVKYSYMICLLKKQFQNLKF